MKRFIRNVQLASLSGLFVFGLTSAAMANTLFVPSQYAQIQDAINAAQEGDTVFVEAGQYEIIDAIHMKEKVNLIGADNQAVVLNGFQDISEPVIYGANKSMLAGFTIIQDGNAGGFPYGTAILLDNVQQMTIKNNVVNGHAERGISLNNSHYNVIENNIVRPIETTKTISCALHLTSSSYNYILNNKLNGSSEGLWAYYGIGNIVEHNLFRKVAWGASASSGAAAYFNTSRDLRFWHNTCICLTTQTRPGAGLALLCPVNVQIKNCLIYGRKVGLHVEIDQNPIESVAIGYSDIKGDQQNVLLIGNGSPIYGNGVLYLDPKVNLVNGKISAASPCRNSGDPTTPNDPDGSRADMGAFYYTLDVSPPPQPKR